METDVPELSELRRQLAQLWPGDLIEFAVDQYRHRLAAEEEIRKIKQMTVNFYEWLDEYPLEPIEPQGPRLRIRSGRIRLASGDA